MNSNLFHPCRYSQFLNGVMLPLHSQIKLRKYATLRRFVEETQWWDREKLEQFQFQEFRKVLRVAFDSVPFYQKRYAEAGVRYEDIQTPDDIRTLPVLERDDVKRFKDSCARRPTLASYFPTPQEGPQGRRSSSIEAQKVMIGGRQ